MCLFRFFLSLQEQEIKKLHFNNRRKIFPMCYRLAREKQGKEENIKENLVIK